jgi:hypothetical protein
VVQEVVLRVIMRAGLTAGLKVRPTVVQELVLRVITTAGLTAGLTAENRRWPASAAPVRKPGCVTIRLLAGRPV